MWQNKYLLLGGSTTLAGRKALAITGDSSWWLKQWGMPFNNLGPQNSPIAISWTTQVQSITVVMARAIHTLILGLTINLLDLTISSPPKTLNPISISSLSQWSPFPSETFAHLNIIAFLCSSLSAYTPIGGVRLTPRSSIRGLKKQLKGWETEKKYWIQWCY